MRLCSPRSLVALICAPALMSAAPAAAQAASPDFTVTPVGGGVYPRFEAGPGERVGGSVRLVNHASRTRVLRVQPLDAATADTGGVWFPPGAPRAGGRWLSVAQRDVRLGPRAERVVRFSARLPATATPGEHYAGLIVADRADLRRAERRTAEATSARAGVKIEHVARLALPVRIVVPGPAGRKLAVTGADFAADATGTRLDLALRNDGGRLVRSTVVDLAVADERGRVLFRHRGRMPEFLPATAVRYPVAWRARPAGGTYRLTGTIRPRGAPAVRVARDVSFTRRSARALERATGEQAAPAPGHPWQIIALVAAALLLAAGSTAAYVRVRRRLRALSVARPA